MNRKCLILITILAGILLGVLFRAAHTSGKIATASVGILFAWVIVSLWNRLPRRIAVWSAPTGSQKIVDPTSLLVKAETGHGTFWRAFTQLLFKTILLHVSNLNQGQGARIKSVIEYLATHNLESLDSALSSSDDSEIRETWGFYKEHVDERVLRSALMSISNAAVRSPDLIILHGEIGQFAYQTQF